MSTDFTRVFDLLAYQAARYPEARAVNVHTGADWQSWSTESLRSRVGEMAAALAGMGVSKGDCLVIIPKTGHIEWVVLDFACQMLGGILVPVHATASVENIGYILRETQAPICIAQTADLFEKLGNLDLPELKTLGHLEPGAQGYWNPKMDADAKPDWPTITPDDVFCIMYTSGTTGPPKGVMLTHNNMVSNIKAVLALLPINYQHRALSFLPLSHIFERMAVYTYLAAGVALYFSRDRESLFEEFRVVRPHFMTAVPRILEKFYEGLRGELKKSRWLRKSLINWALDLGKNYGDRPRLDLRYTILVYVARLLVFSRLKKRLGGHLKGILVGASALKPEIAKMFGAAGIRVREGYGLTETSPVISVNRFEPGMNMFGSVGLPAPGVRIRIFQPDEEGIGEIQVTGPNVMKGYFKKPEATAAAFTPDGWFKTGDTGMLVNKRFLKIKGRLTDVFKTSSGKFVSPEEEEAWLVHSPFIADALVEGFQKPYLVAVIAPDFPELERWCKENNIHYTAPEYMVHNIKVIERIGEEIDRINAGLPNYKRIRKFHLTADEWTQENGSYTVSQKKIRKKLLAQYAKEIEKMTNILS
ncbi:MAG: long-chain fatty acid--CoA ligase [Lewinellaceae bacterium]|nr:long-chain fatty acid--CoA ligase [Lewinellaceae bacterium]